MTARARVVLIRTLRARRFQGLIVLSFELSWRLVLAVRTEGGGRSGFGDRVGPVPGPAPSNFTTTVRFERFQKR
jgi:hypothetical protein